MVMGVAAFAAYPPGVAAAEAGGESAGTARLESVAEPDLPGVAEDHPRWCDREHDWSATPRLRPQGETECPHPVFQAVESGWNCCEDDESQEETKESTDADERGDSSSDARTECAGDSSSDTDERGDSSHALEDDDLAASGADVDRPAPVLLPVDSDDLGGDDDVPLVDDDL